ncbi:unnamed protein product [Linum trigynum]|uniref:Uncharacterized protein n=1 Tax=Linum trigynum TaxID=586398 RepID=A0AAV2CAN4_9ROSI
MTNWGCDLRDYPLFIGFTGCDLLDQRTLPLKTPEDLDRGRNLESDDGKVASSRISETTSVCRHVKKKERPRAD